MELNKERREYISTLADRIMREMVNDGYDPLKAFDYIALDDVYAKKLQQAVAAILYLRRTPKPYSSRQASQ